MTLGWLAPELLQSVEATRRDSRGTRVSTGSLDLRRVRTLKKEKVVRELARNAGHWSLTVNAWHRVLPTGQ